MKDWFRVKCRFRSLLSSTSSKSLNQFRNKKSQSPAPGNRCRAPVCASGSLSLSSLCVDSFIGSWDGRAADLPVSITAA